MLQENLILRPLIWTWTQTLQVIFNYTIMVKKKKGGVGKQRKPKKEKPVKEKHEDVPVKPKKERK